MRFLSFLFLILSLSGKALAASPQPILAKHGMVVSEHYLASKAGEDILRAGGNAIDAAVAVGYALAVVNPCCGNIGGGGFMLMRLANGKIIFINFREKAPQAASAAMFLDAKGNIVPEKSLKGYLAVGVPGTILGLDTALKKYGTLTRQQVMQPAIRLARQGYSLTHYEVKQLNDEVMNFRAQPNVAAIFLKKNQSYQVGDKLIQKDLANTLEQIAQKGADIFYKGWIAKSIVTASQANGGVLSLADFAHYNVTELSPLTCHYRGYTIISAPPPSSGGTTLCEMTNILENYPLSNLGYHSSQSIHFITEAMRYAFADRNNYLGDPEFVNNPVEKLISPAYAKSIQQKILPAKAATSLATPTKGFTHESINTTHYSVADDQGNFVAVTYTLNSFFGSKVIAGNTGFFLNNVMDDFTAQPGQANQFGLVEGKANEIQPGKRPLSSMTPTLLMKDNNVVMVLGSPGGPRIITSVLQTLLNVIDYRMNIQEAIDAPRFHHQWQPDQIEFEPYAFSADTAKNLQTMGYHFSARQSVWSGVEAIWIDPATKVFYGASDSRRPDGKAVGW